VPVRCPDAARDEQAEKSVVKLRNKGPETKKPRQAKDAATVISETGSRKVNKVMVDRSQIVPTAKLTKSRQRVADHGEVFTPNWLVEAMLDLVKDETIRVDSRFLEPACGSGNFLVKVLQRKLAVVDTKYGGSDFERRNYSLLGVMCIYGVELLQDNVEECRANLLGTFAECLGLAPDEETYRAAHHVLSENLVHGDAMKMCTFTGEPITFAEWGYLGRGKFQRRDFRLDSLTLSSTFSTDDSLFSMLGKHEIFTPTTTYPQMTISDLARLTPREAS